MVVVGMKSPFNTSARVWASINLALPLGKTVVRFLNLIMIFVSGKCNRACEPLNPYKPKKSAEKQPFNLFCLRRMSMV